MGEEGRWIGERRTPSSSELIMKTGDNLTWQRAPMARQLTREENDRQEIGNSARGGGEIMRGREES
jgi:hypothetical protein